MTPLTPQFSRVLGNQELDRNSVHVWSASLDGRLEDVCSLLSAEEIARAARFRFDRDRDRFASGRALLRRLLAAYTGRRAEDIGFAYSVYGKPRLVGATQISFNVSHSGNRALFALGSGVDVGVDIELLDPNLTDERVPERFFSPREVSELRSLPKALQPRAFLTCWTRKEAYIKAHGPGLSLPLHDFDVTLRPGDPPLLRGAKWSATEPGEWSLYDLSDEHAGYVAALAVRAADVTVSRRGWVLRDISPIGTRRTARGGAHAAVR